MMNKYQCKLLVPMISRLSNDFKRFEILIRNQDFDEAVKLRDELADKLYEFTKEFRKEQ